MSNIKIDIEKIKEERKKFENDKKKYNEQKLKRKIKPDTKLAKIEFVGLKENLSKLEINVNGALFPIEEYEIAPGENILDTDNQLFIWNSTSAFKNATYQIGQKKLIIKNIVNHKYSNEEKETLGIKLFNLMSVDSEHTKECLNVLNKWVSEYTPNFIDVCIVFENLGLNVESVLKEKYYYPSELKERIELDKEKYNKFNAKVTDETINIECLKSVFVYLNDTIGKLNQNEVESMFVLLCNLALDKMCIELTDTSNETIENCFDHIKNVNYDKLLYTFFVNINNTHNQIHFINNLLKTTNDKLKHLNMKLSYLYLCNLLFNDAIMRVECDVIEIDSSSQELSDNTLKIIENNECLKPLLNLLKVKEESTSNVHNTRKRKNESDKVSKSKRAARGSKSLNTSEDNLQQQSIIQYFTRANRKDCKEEASSSTSVNDIENDISNMSVSNENKRALISKANDESKIETVQSDSKTKDINKNETNKDKEDEIKFETANVLNETKSSKIEDDNINTIDEIYNKYKDDIITLELLYIIINKKMIHFVNNPLKIYRIANVLNNIISMIEITKDNMDTLQNIIKTVSKVKQVYVGLHDIHKHLVNVYLQQYRTKWSTEIIKIKYDMEEERNLKVTYDDDSDEYDDDFDVEGNDGDDAMCID